MKLLGVDHGLRIIGLAIHDSAIGLSWPIDPIYSSEWQRCILPIIEERMITKIIVGWPLMINGIEGEQCKQVDLFIKDLQNLWNGEFVKQDERFTNHMSRSAYGIDNDSISAMMIIENYLSRVS